MPPKVGGNKKREGGGPHQASRQHTPEATLQEPSTEAASTTTGSRREPDSTRGNLKYQVCWKNKAFLRGMGKNNKQPTNTWLVYTAKLQIFSKNTEKLYSTSIHRLIESGDIKRVRNCKGQFLSKYFLRKKPSGEYRFILNLKRLNAFLSPPHFKLEDIRTAKNLIFKNSYLASIDLKDAYFLV
nr:unnamed protein product [Callosobruchus chinensis]